MLKFTKVEIFEEKNWEALVEIVRQVPLLGDRTVVPYTKVKIESRVVEINQVYPISRYVLTDQIEVQRQLHRLLLKQGIDTLDLDGKRGRIRFRVPEEKQDWVMSAPVVEISEIDGGKPVLVDGEHRFRVAKELKQKVRVIWISQVPKEFPVVATPVRWGEIKEYGETPEVAKKRDYRYPTLDSFPDVSAFSKVKVTQDNWRYFFYRDLDEVSSTFVREPGKVG